MTLTNRKLKCGWKTQRGEQMKKLQLRTLGGALLAILMLATLAQVAVSAQGTGSDRSLVGSWDVEVTARDC